jgi:hypothetical protein
MRKLRIVLIVVIAILSIAALKTAVPAEEASKVCLLGYNTFCSFTPVSTLILVLAALGIFFTTRKIILERSN